MIERNFSSRLLSSLGVSPERVHKVLPRVKMESAKLGDVLISKGQCSKHWTYILSGFVGTNAPTKNGHSVPVDIFGSNCWFGETMVLHERSSPLEYVCLSNASMLTIPADDVREAFAHDAKFTRTFARLLAWRGAIQTEIIGLIKTGNPQMRVVMGLALLASSLNGNVLPQLGSEVKANNFHIPLKQSLLASSCGVSRGVFSALAQKLADAGWIQVNYGTLELLSIPSWCSLLQAYRQARSDLNHLPMTELLALSLDGSEKSANLMN